MRSLGALSYQQVTPSPNKVPPVARYHATLFALRASCRTDRSPQVQTKCLLSHRQVTPSPDKVPPVAKYQGTLSAQSASVDEFLPKNLGLGNARDSAHTTFKEVDVKKYRSSAASDIRVAYGVELIAGVRLFPETASYAAPFEALNNDLNAAYMKRVQLRKPSLEKRAVFRFAHYETDQAIRMAHRGAEIADGGRKNGPITSFLFPEGLGPVVAPFGVRQIEPTEKLIADMKRCKVPDSAAFCAEWIPKLEAALAKLKLAAAEHTAARKAHIEAFQDEVALRSEHYMAVDKLMGHVKAAFPNDRARQDLIFPVVDDSGDNDSTEESEE